MLPKSIGLLLSGGFFVVVHNVFPINYQWVLKVFPKMFSIVLSHTFCPKLNFHIYTYIHYKGGQRKWLNASILGSAQCLKKLWWGQSKWLLQKKIEKILVVPPQPINRNNNRCPPKWISTLNNNTLSLLFARRNTTLHYILLTSYVRQHNNLLRSQIVGFLSPVKGAGILPLEGTSASCSCKHWAPHWPFVFGDLVINIDTQLSIHICMLHRFGAPKG